MKTFRAFVVEQVSRGEALPPAIGYVYSEAAQKAICDWFEERSGENPKTEKQSVLQWLQDSPGARKVKAVMDEIMEGDKAPTMADMRAVWNRLHGKEHKVNPNCELCHGTGWQIMEVDGTEAARRCPAGCETPQHVSELQQGHLRTTEADKEANSRMAKEFGRELAEKLAKPMKPAKDPPRLDNPIQPKDFDSVEKFKR
jgi:hypothetical protein